MNRGQRPKPCCRPLTGDGPERLSGRNLICRNTPSHIMSPTRNQPGPSAEVSLGVRRPTPVPQRAHAPPLLSLRRFPSPTTHQRHPLDNTGPAQVSRAAEARLGSVHVPKQSLSTRAVVGLFAEGTLRAAASTRRRSSGDETGRLRSWHRDRFVPATVTPQFTLLRERGFVGFMLSDRRLVLTQSLVPGEPRGLCVSSMASWLNTRDDRCFERLIRKEVASTLGRDAVPSAPRAAVARAVDQC